MKTTDIGNEELHRFGSNFIDGALTRVCWYVGLGLMAIWAINGVASAFDVGLDDSDKSSSERSGLEVHTDHKTGVQYLSDGHGGFHVRVDADGKAIVNYDKNKAE